MTQKVNVNVNVNAANREISGVRLYDAPREMVFDVWTDPAHITHWWGPRGFSTTTEKMDLRPGGEWLFVMTGPDGRDYENRVVYREVVRPERLVYRHAGRRDDDPMKFVVTVDFVAHGNRTEVKFRMVIDTDAMFEEATKFGAVEGLRDTMTRFDEYLQRHGEEQSA